GSDLLKINIFCNFLFKISYIFFSSRRRHTSFSRDWSSDVCSSDLELGGSAHGGGDEVAVLVEEVGAHGDEDAVAIAVAHALADEIGRASCREEYRCNWLQHDAQRKKI